MLDSKKKKKKKIGQIFNTGHRNRDQMGTIALAMLVEI